MVQLLPRQEKFYLSFLEQITIINAAADKLLQAVQHSPQNMTVMAQAVSADEAACDAATNAAIEHLHHAFLTPYDPEDILALSSSLDDVMDGIEDVAHRLADYHINPVPPAMIRLCQIIAQCAAALDQALKAQNSKKPAINFVNEIIQLEKTADDIERHAVAALFDSELNPITVMKQREIYDYLEDTVDACEHVASVIQHIRVKNG
jgi:uncharacterized protein